MPKLSRDQLNEIKKARAAAKEAENAKLTAADPEHLPEAQQKRDRRGFTAEERAELRKQTYEADHNVNVRYNINMSDLVELPDGSIGMVVRDAEAVHLKKNQLRKADTKNAVKASKYYNKVYVLTSNGNDWHLASRLRKIHQN